MEDPNPLIGIVGGMGPHAGLDLAHKVLANTLAGSDQEHLPLALFSTPELIPDRTAFLNGGSDANPAIPVADALAVLDRMGATVAGMPCVTAHAPRIFGEVVRRTADARLRVRLLSIVEETIRHLRLHHADVRAVAALSTSGSYRHRVLFDPIETAGYTVVEHDPAIQETLIQDAIYNPVHGIKAHPDPVTRQARDQIEAALEHVRNRGAEAVILGCTELPLAVRRTTWRGLRLIDPTTMLARALIAATYPDRLRPLEP